MRFHKEVERIVPNALSLKIPPPRSGLKTRIETYTLLLGSPRAARGEKAAATQNLDTALKDLKDLCEAASTN
jgi:hypothetical protein